MISNDFKPISLNLNKEECAIITKGPSPEYTQYILSSSEENMIQLDNYYYPLANKNTNILLFNDNNSNNENYFIFINSYKQKSTVKGYAYKSIDIYAEDKTPYYYNTLYFNFIFNNKITDEFNKYKTDFIFRRFNTYSSNWALILHILLIYKKIIIFI